MVVKARVYQVEGIERTRQAYASSAWEVEMTQKQKKGWVFSRGMSSNTQAMTKIHLIHSLPWLHWQQNCYSRKKKIKYQILQENIFLNFLNRKETYKRRNMT